MDFPSLLVQAPVVTAFAGIGKKTRVRAGFRPAWLQTPEGVCTGPFAESFAE
jgi:hypothetical protein